MQFKSTAVKATGPTTADVTGDFSFRYVTKPLTLHVKFNGAGIDPDEQAYVVEFSVTGEFNRSDWGFKTAIPGVGDQLEAAFKKP